MSLSENDAMLHVTLSLSKGDIESHYASVAPIMERLFGHIPIVWTTFLNTPDETRTFHQQCFGHYSHLSAEHAEHLVSIGAREFYSWFPVPDDPTRARYARFLLCHPAPPCHPEVSKDREPVEAPQASSRHCSLQRRLRRSRQAARPRQPWRLRRRRCS